MVSADLVPTIPLPAGKAIPVIGLGTWKSQPGKVEDAVKAAIDSGYRHFDCAWIYQNEKEIGDAIRAKIDDGTVKREDLFITTKVWNTFHRKDLVPVNLKESLERLGLAYVDLTLVHWPMAYKEEGEPFPTDENGKTIFSDVSLKETWEAMEDLVSAGLTKEIGLSNFNTQQIQHILDVAKIKPVVNQVESHPWLPQSKLFAFCKEKGLVVEAYSPLGSPDRPWATSSDPILLEDETLKELADKYGKSVAQICIKFQVQRGAVVLPKTVTSSRIAENIEIFDFEISDEDMAKIEALDRGEEARVCSLSHNREHPEYPFWVEK